MRGSKERSLAEGWSNEGKGKFIIGFDGRSVVHSVWSTRSQVVRHPRLVDRKILLDSRCSLDWPADRPGDRSIVRHPYSVQTRLRFFVCVSVKARLCDLNSDGEWMMKDHQTASSEVQSYRNAMRPSCRPAGCCSLYTMRDRLSHEPLCGIFH